MGFLRKLAVTAVLGSLLFRSPLRAAELRSGENLSMTGEFTDNLYVSGGHIRCDVQSTDDVFIAGGEISFTGRTRENLWFAGGDLTLEKAEARDAILAGGKLMLTNTHFREIVAAGGQIQLRQVQLEDDLIALGGEILVDGDSTVKGSSLIAGGKVTLAGHFVGDVQVSASQLQIGPTAVIDGTLTHKTESLEISPSAKVVGKIVAMPAQTSSGSKKAFGIAMAILLALGGLLVAPIVGLFFSRLADRADVQIRSRFWENLGRGLVAILFIPVILLLLFSSVLGVPLALAALPFVIAILILAWSVALFSLALWLRFRISKHLPESLLSKQQRFSWTLLASFVVALIFMIPVIGQICALLVLLVGLGALLKWNHS
jgi:cytoskeletal protein CcmA (bactofilin family)